MYKWSLKGKISQLEKWWRSYPGKRYKYPSSKRLHAHPSFSPFQNGILITEKPLKTDHWEYSFYNILGKHKMLAYFPSKNYKSNNFCTLLGRDVLHASSIPYFFKRGWLQRKCGVIFIVESQSTQILWKEGCVILWMKNVELWESGKMKFMKNVVYPGNLNMIVM